MVLEKAAAAARSSAQRAREQAAQLKARPPEEMALLQKKGTNALGSQGRVLLKNAGVRQGGGGDGGADPPA